MQSHNITAKQLTQVIGLSSSAISEWKKGKAKPSAEAVVKIAEHFHVTTDYLFNLTDNPQPANEKNRASMEVRDELIHEALAGTGLLGENGLLTKEGAAVIAKFLNQNSEMLNQLLKQSEEHNDN